MIVEYTIIIILACAFGIDRLFIYYSGELEKKIKLQVEDTNSKYMKDVNSRINNKINKSYEEWKLLLDKVKETIPTQEVLDKKLTDIESDLKAIVRRAVDKHIPKSKDPYIELFREGIEIAKQRRSATVPEMEGSGADAVQQAINEGKIQVLDEKAAEKIFSKKD